jgi:hypothetical protein
MCIFDLLFVIIQLMLSVSICPKVIPKDSFCGFDSVYCVQKICFVDSIRKNKNPNLSQVVSICPRISISTLLCLMGGTTFRIVISVLQTNSKS